MSDALLAVAVGFAGLLAVTWAFPVVLPRLVFLPLVRLMYRFRVHHLERVPATGPALVVCNHVSYLDWLVLVAVLPQRAKFVLWAGYYKNPFLRLLLSWARYRTIRIESRAVRPRELRDALSAVTAALDRGDIVVLFPEGRLTRNGQMRPFQRGCELAVRRAAADVPIVPTCTSGLWGSLLSHESGRMLWKWPKGLRRRVSVWFGEPLPKDTPTAVVRAAVVEGIADLAIAEKGDVLPPARWLIRTASRWRNAGRVAFVDVATGTEKRLTFPKGFVAVWVLANWLHPRVKGSEPVGVWLPTGLGSALTNFALALLRRTTVNLNYTAGPAPVESAARQVGMRYVVTAKRFEAKMPLDLPADIERLYLEDALTACGSLGKLRRLLMVLLLPAFVIERLFGLNRVRPDDLLTVVFSSGSTGEPKGVMLTQANVGANTRAFEIGVDLKPRDVMLSTLPFFHSFGYTVNMWAPTCIGMTAVYYPDPRAAKEVGELCRRHACNIMMGTATFLRFYLRRSGPDDFKSLRLLVCGAEKLPVKLAHEFADKFGVMPMEGYGCTELSPVVCANLPDTTAGGLTQRSNVFGTVGQPIPGVVAKAFDPETLAPLPPVTEGVLCVKGPNVMAGYWGQPERTKKVVFDGWYVTGDMGRIEDDGFIRITGRLSRFAKMAGEMVPLERVEEEMQELLGTGERLVTVCAVPDDKRGERLVVLYLADAADKLTDVLRELPKRGLPNLWVPDRRDCYPVDAFPALGSGKLDLRGVGELARQLAVGRGQ